MNFEEMWMQELFTLETGKVTVINFKVITCRGERLLTWWPQD